MLDKICEKLGGYDDIWYATNMETYVIKPGETINIKPWEPKK